MKKAIILFVSALMLGLAFTSCSKDDDSNSSSPTPNTLIEGKWRHSKYGAIIDGQEHIANYHNNCTTKKDYLELIHGGAANATYYNIDCAETVLPINWSKSGNTLTIDYGGHQEVLQIVTLDATTLKTQQFDPETGNTYFDIYTRL